LSLLGCERVGISPLRGYGREASGSTSKRKIEMKKVLKGGCWSALGLLVVFVVSPTSSQPLPPVPPMTNARANHTATLLNTGQVLVAGGQASNGSPISSVEIYTPQGAGGNQWSPAKDLLTARYNHTATLLQNGQVLVVGGWDSPSSVLDSAELYNPATNTWSYATAPATKRAGHTATLLNDGRVFIFGGVSGIGTGVPPAVGAEIYDPAKNTWVTLSGVNTLTDHTATLLQNDNVLICGGVGSGGPTWNCEIYDPTNNQWTPAAHLLGEVHYIHTATLLENGDVLVAGGWGDPSCSGNPCATPSTIDYNPASNAWTGVQSLNYGRAAHTATLLTSPGEPTLNG
jgi:N-acetylneuraminic acid mutarotase